MPHTASVLSDEQLDRFNRDGFLVVEGLFSQAEVDEIRETFMHEARNGPVEGLSETRRGNTTYAPTDPLAFYPRMMHPHKHADKAVGRIAMRYMLDARIEAVLFTLMGEPAFAAQSMFYFKPPGARGQDFHQDNFYLRVKPGTCMAAWCAIDPCDAGNGAMLCVPQTQDAQIVCPEPSDNTIYFTSEHVPIPEGKVAVLPEMKPGDVLFFNGSTIHGSGPNTSKDRFRRSLIFHYLPASTTAISRFYEVIDFQGNRLESVEHNEDGGPCGTMSGVAAPH